MRRALLEHTARIGWADFAARNASGPPPGFFDRLLWPALRYLVSRRVMAAFGGRMRVAVSGGAELPPEIGRALVGLGLPLVEGYGLTEAGLVVTASRIEAYRPGSVGFALPEIALRVSEADELWVRTPSCMTGYWNMPAATTEAFDADGWLRTGDMTCLEDGRVNITGRLKDILVLSNGENVNPHPIETTLLADHLFMQCCVIGDGEAFVAALVVLDPEVWGSLAQAAGVAADDPNAPAAHDFLLGRIKRLLQDFPAHHQVRALHVDLSAWTPERGLLTPTLKPKRREITRFYAANIERIFKRRSGSYRTSTEAGLTPPRGRFLHRR